MHILWQLQLSNYNEGVFILSGDSNWTIFLSKARELVRLNNDIQITLLVPQKHKCKESIIHLLRANNLRGHVYPIELPIEPNALVTRYDFPFRLIGHEIFNRISTPITHAFINDPMLLGHYKALFFHAGVKAKFICQIHFLDSPNCRVVDESVSYWRGTIEACEKSDVFVWHSYSMQDMFEEELYTEHNEDFCVYLMRKSTVWKSGHSRLFLDEPFVMSNIRPWYDGAREAIRNKRLIWVPNRVGGLGSGSLDYTNNGAFLEALSKSPSLMERNDWMIAIGNPSQKVPTDTFRKMFGDKYLDLGLPEGPDGALRPDEYRTLALWSDIVVALYDKDTNGGIAVLEAMHYGAMPLMPDIYEYHTYFDDADTPIGLRVEYDGNIIPSAIRTLKRMLDAAPNILKSYAKELQLATRCHAIEFSTRGFYDTHLRGL